MSTTRRRGSIRKLPPAQTAPFDEQFWPVSLALCLTAAIAAGAAVSLLRGPWMWTALIALPALLAAALFALQRVRPGLLKRSLQLAVILSAGVHLLFLILCSLMDVFGRPQPIEPVAESKPSPERMMVVSRRESNPIWRELNRREAPDPKLETDREPTKVEPQPPQPIEVAQPRPTATPAASRRNESAPAQPKFDQGAAEVRRSSGPETPTSAAAAVDAPAPSRKPAAQPGESAAAAKASAASAGATSEALERLAADSGSISASAAPQATEVQAARRATATAQGQFTASAEADQPSTARTRDRPVEIPRTATRAAALQPAVPQPAASEPVVAELAERVPSPPEVSAGRAEQTETALRAAATELKESAVPAEPSAVQASRRGPEPNPPAISLEDSRVESSRRSNQAAEQVASLRPVEAPSPAPATARGSVAAPQTASTSLTRAESGSALAADGANLQVSDLQAAGVAVVASDSVSRRRAEQTAAAPLLLNSQQAADERRTAAENPTPQSAWQVNTESLALRSGARSPALQSLKSSAATATTAASSAERSRLNLEAGSSQIDLGPTKLAADSAAERTSGGGGAAALGPLNPEPKSPRRTAPAAAGTLLSEVVGLTQAPRSAPSETRPAGEPRPMEAQASASRAGQLSRVAVGSGELTERETDQALQVEEESTKPRSTRRPRTAGESSGIASGELAELQSGNQRAGISRAPITQVEVQLGSLSTEAAKSSLAAGESNLEIELRSAPSGSVLMAEAREAVAGATESAAGPGLATRRRAELREGIGAADNDSGGTARRGTELASPSLESAVAGGAAPASRAAGRTTVDAAEVESAAGLRGASARLEVTAELGSAGLGLRPDQAPGSRSRASSRESESLALNVDSRFNRADSGAMPMAASDAVLAKEAFSARGAPGSEPSTEAAIELGLEFLARHQRADGSWSLGGFDPGHPQKQGQFHSDMAATGLALLAFQGAGYTHREFKYAPQLQRAIDWMTARQDAAGGLYLESDERSNQNCRMYSHAIASLALCEAFGMTQDSRLREPCRQALAYIAGTQDERGGWRYYAEPQMRQSDTSVTGWMLMALQSGRLSGIEVPAETWSGIEQWLQVAHDPQREGLFRYNPFAEDTGGVNRSAGRRPTVSMTSVGLLMRLYTGWKRTDPRTLEGADYLLAEQLPGDRTSVERDTYYWYYATQVFRHVGGERWEQWQAKLHPLLVHTQIQTGDSAGSWDPYAPVPDRWGSAAGRLYVTAMNLLSLEVNYRLLPLYEEYRTAQDR